MRRPKKRQPLTPEQSRLAGDNWPLAMWVARKTATKYGGHPDDYLGEAQMALVDAALMFDPGRGFKFTTYATNCMFRRVSFRRRDRRSLCPIDEWALVPDRRRRSRY